MIQEFKDAISHKVLQNAMNQHQVCKSPLQSYGVLWIFLRAVGIESIIPVVGKFNASNLKCTILFLKNPGFNYIVI